MTRRHGVVLPLLAAIVGLSGLGVLPAAAAAVVAPPTHLRPVQSKTDCAAILSLAAFVCDAAVRAGDLQLIWDESDTAVTGYNVYRVDGGGHSLLGAAAGTARYYVPKKPSGGYARMCFAVQASVGSQASADSARYCYAPGATAATRTFKPSRTLTQVTWSAPAGVTCGGSVLFGSAFFRTVDKTFGPAFTVFFPWLTKEKWVSDTRSVNGAYGQPDAQAVANRTFRLGQIPALGRCLVRHPCRGCKPAVVALSDRKTDVRQARLGDAQVSAGVSR